MTYITTLFFVLITTSIAFANDYEVHHQVFENGKQTYAFKQTFERATQTIEINGDPEDGNTYFEIATKYGSAMQGQLMIALCHDGNIDTLGTKCSHTFYSDNARTLNVEFPYKKYTMRLRIRPLN